MEVNFLETITFDDSLQVNSNRNNIVENNSDCDCNCDCECGPSDCGDCNCDCPTDCFDECGSYS